MLKNRLFLLVMFFVFLFAPISANSDSIWQDNVGISPYSTQKAYRVGDIVYVLIVESTSALQKGTTKTQVKDELSANLTHTINKIASIIPLDTDITGKADLKYQGGGQTERTSTVQAKVAARVTEVLPNGVLKITGQHVVAVNDEEQSIIITGVIRSKDISMANTVYSYQVAGATVSVQGAGVLGEAQSPGWFTRMFNWLF